jgi:hypothetical protein
MMARAEKLFNIRAQVQKAISEIDHGDTYASCWALSDALAAVLVFLEEEMPEKISVAEIAEQFQKQKEREVGVYVPEKVEIHLRGEEVKEPQPVRTKGKK